MSNKELLINQNLQFLQSSNSMQKISSFNKNYTQIRHPFQNINNHINKLSQLFQGEDLLRKQIYTALNASKIQNESDRHKNQLSQYEGDITTKSIPFDDMQNDDQFYKNSLHDHDQINNFSQIADDSCTILINGNLSLPKQKSQGSLKQKILSSLQFNDDESCVITTQNQQQKTKNKFCQEIQLKQSKTQKDKILNKNKNRQNEDSDHNKKMLNKNVSSLCISHLSKQKINKQLSLKKQMGLNKQALIFLQDKKLTKKGNFSTNRKQLHKRQKGNKSLNANQLTYSGQIIVYNKQTVRNKNVVSHQAISQKKKKNSKTKTSSANALTKQQICNFVKNTNKCSQKIHKKLNRINICHLQQNIKKGNKDITTQKNILKDINQNRNKDKKQQKSDVKLLKLNFNKNTIQGAIEKNLEEKDLIKKLNTQKKIYLQISQRIDLSHWKQLRKQLQSPTQNAILKLKIVSLIICFFSQFSLKNINQKTNSKRNPLYRLNVFVNKKKSQKNCQISSQQEETIQKILQHPEQIVELITTLPQRLHQLNIVSEKYLNDLFNGYQQLNFQLDQQLDFFVLKKTLIFQYLHALCEFLTFLLQKNLIEKTDRKNVNDYSTKNSIQGYYSSRGGRQNSLNKNKIIQKRRQCDSDRKKTISDQQQKVSRIWEVLNEIKRKNL